MYFITMYILTCITLITRHSCNFSLRLITKLMQDNYEESDKRFTPDLAVVSIREANLAGLPYEPCENSREILMPTILQDFCCKMRNLARVECLLS